MPTDSAVQSTPVQHDPARYALAVRRVAYQLAAEASRKDEPGEADSGERYVALAVEPVPESRVDLEEELVSIDFAAVEIGPFLAAVEEELAGWDRDPAEQRVGLTPAGVEAADVLAVEIGGFGAGDRGVRITRAKLAVLRDAYEMVARSGFGLEELIHRAQEALGRAEEQAARERGS